MFFYDRLESLSGFVTVTKEGGAEQTDNCAHSLTAMRQNRLTSLFEHEECISLMILYLQIIFQFIPSDLFIVCTATHRQRCFASA